MKLFGFDIKLPMTKRSKVKKSLLERGRHETIKYMVKELWFNKLSARKYTYDLICEGCMDMDLIKLYQISGIGVLRKTLITQYKFNPAQMIYYITKVKEFKRG